jgi:ribosomal protein S8
MTSSNSFNKMPNSITIGGWWQSSIALFITLMVLHIAIKQSTAPDLGTVDLSSIESKSIAHDNYYAEVSGYADATIAESKSKRGQATPQIYIPLHQQENSKASVHLIISVSENELSKYVKVDPLTKKMTVKGHVTSIMSKDVANWLQSNGVSVTEDTKYIIPSVNRESAKSVGLVFGVVGLAATIGLFHRRSISFDISKGIQSNRY